MKTWNGEVVTVLKYCSGVGTAKSKRSCWTQCVTLPWALWIFLYFDPNHHGAFEHNQNVSSCYDYSKITWNMLCICVFLCALVTSESRWASVPLWRPVCPGPVTQAPPQPVAWAHSDLHSRSVFLRWTMLWNMPPHRAVRSSQARWKPSQIYFSALWTNPGTVNSSPREGLQVEL